MKTSLFLVLMVLGYSQSIAQVKQERKLDSFTKISVSQAITLHLTQGENHSVYVEALADDQDKIMTDVINGQLIIRRDNKRKKEFKGGKVTVYVTVKNCTSLNVSSATTVVGKTAFHLNNFNLQVSEASKVNLDLTAQEVQVDMSGASSATLNLNVKQLSGKLTEASHLKIKGSYGKNTIETQTASSIETI